MDIFIYDLDLNSVDKITNDDTDRFGRITRKETELNHTVDMLINVRTVAIDDNYIVVEYPNGNAGVFNIPSFHYHKIEVL